MVNVLVLTTSSRFAEADLEAIRASFPEDERLRLRVVGLFRPAERLRVRRYLQVGPSLRPGRAVQEARTRAKRRPDGPPLLAGPGRVGSALDRGLTRVLPERWTASNALRLATGCVLSREVLQEVRRADFVVAMDWNTTWAAWLLARRVAGPEVVFQADGLRLKLAELEAARALTG